MTTQLPKTLIPRTTVAELLGCRDIDELALGTQMVEMLQQLAPELAPQELSEPWASYVHAGPASFDALWALYDEHAEATPEERALILDAVAEVISKFYPTEQTVQRLRQALSEARTEVVASAAARALALAKDEDFLGHQLEVLTRGRLSEQRAAIHLLGCGRYRAAAPILLEMLSPENVIVVDKIIWALGELEAVEAVPALHDWLQRGFYLEEVLESLGLIGASTSLMQLLPFLDIGTLKQQRIAARAVVRILRRRYGLPGLEVWIDETSRVLKATINRSRDGVVNFYCIAALGILGERVPPSRISALFTERRSDASAGPRHSYPSTAAPSVRTRPVPPSQ